MSKITDKCTLCWQSVAAKSVDVRIECLWLYELVSLFSSINNEFL